MNTATATPSIETPPPPLPEADKPNGKGHAEPAVVAAAVVEAAKPAAPEPKPLNFVQVTEDYIARIRKEAESENNHLSAEIIEQRCKVAQLNIAMLRMEEGKKQIKDRLELEVETLDSMEKQEKLSAEEEKIQPPLPFDAAKKETDDKLQSDFDALTLGQIGVSGQLKDLLEADGIRDGKALRVWINDHTRRDISGIGKGKIDKLSELMADKMLSMRTPAEKTPLKIGRNSIVGHAATGELPPPEVQAEQDVKVTNLAAKKPEPDAVPVAQAMGDVTPRDVKGNPKKFKGSKPARKSHELAR